MMVHQSWTGHDFEDALNFMLSSLISSDSYLQTCQAWSDADNIHTGELLPGQIHVPGLGLHDTPVVSRY